MPALTARYFKIETFGAVDGPGIRLVIFLQGCPLRCKYCHNPESWSIDGPSQYISVAEIIALYQNNQAYYKNGGITISGGEPTLQLDFLIALATQTKQLKIHLTIDTAAYFFNLTNALKFAQLIELVDLWLIDIKHIIHDKYILVTGSTQQHEIEFIKYLELRDKPYWIRQVLVPGLTNTDSDLLALGKFLKTLKHMQKFEILPYHDMAKDKYKQMQINYPLATVLPPTYEQVKHAMDIINTGMNKPIK